MANSVVNLGIGMPEGVSSVAAEEGDRPADADCRARRRRRRAGLGAQFRRRGSTPTPSSTSPPVRLYDGGGLDATFLGLAQADAEGNLNVSKFGPRLAGAGGFINISQNAKKVVFVGTFTAGDLAIARGRQG